MSKIPFTVLVAFLAIAIAGCALVEQGRLVAAEGAGRAAVVECALSIDERTKNLAAVNGWLMGEGYAHRAGALDCDGDGSADF
jgi:hypothetical protein